MPTTSPASEQAPLTYAAGAVSNEATIATGRAKSFGLVALVHGSEMRTDPPSTEWGSLYSVAVRHPKQGHRIEDLARQLYLHSLALQGSTSHPSTDDRLVSEDGILHEAALAVA